MKTSINGKDFTRRKKFPADKLLTFLVAEDSSSTKNELLDFFDMDEDKSSDSAFNQQRSKLKPGKRIHILRLDIPQSLENKGKLRQLVDKLEF